MPPITTAHSLLCSNMRSDMLAHILSYSGACSGANMLIFDSVIGLVVGSAAYRMRGIIPVMS